MKSFRRQSSTVNAGSMADIAFLLLIFFLVTTTISADKGILRKLPNDCPANVDCSLDTEERNVLRILINDHQQIMVEDDLVELNAIKKLTTDFIDNNGSNNCDYCKGTQSAENSDHPKDAVISLSHDAMTKYEVFISVQDEITKAFYGLRKRYAKQTFNKTLEQLTKAELESVKKAYPFVVSEVMVKRND